MDAFLVRFSVSGVETWAFFPPLVALVVSFFTSMGGISGAFLLLPFQMSVLGFSTPSVSATNFVYNIVAIPSGVFRYVREGRMAWPLTWIVVAGTLPGVFLGYYARVMFMPDPRGFKLFVGCVLLYIGARLLWELTERSQRGKAEMKALDARFKDQVKAVREQHAERVAAGLPADAVVKTVSVSASRVVYEFWGERFSFSTPGMLVLAFVVGVVGGAYGIGGGAIIAPFCVAVFRLPIYTVAGAALMGTFLTSIAGVVFYSLIPASGGLSTAPDWPLGILFGAGGFLGMYLGARAQKFVPQKVIKAGLGIVITALSASYVIQFFR